MFEVHSALLESFLYKVNHTCNQYKGC